jgi:3-methyladenine DNA glycosylase AlkD
MEEDARKIINRLKEYANPKNVEGMAHFGIIGKNILGGPSMAILHKMAKEIGKDHSLAEDLWKSKIHEARLLAAFIDDPKLVTEKQMERWVKDFDSWDICDGVCLHLFDRTPWAYKKSLGWSKNTKEYVRRAGFAMMAVLAVHDKKMADKDFLKFFPLIRKAAGDERNFVRKAVNWALRQIGKRNKNLNKAALTLAKKILKQESKSAKWIARDTIRELESSAVQRKISKK